MTIGWQLAAHGRWRLGAAGESAGARTRFRRSDGQLRNARRSEALGIALASSNSGNAHMLRITVQPEPNRIRLKLEGDLAGMWVSEVEESWRATHSMRVGRPLYLDLTDVQHVDRAGRYLLGLLHCSGAHLVASGASMTDLVRTLEHDWPGPVPPGGGTGRRNASDRPLHRLFRWRRQ